jgi:hypothetical protein
MTVNTRISASDYNTIRNLAAKILGNSGTTTPTFGYGQTVVSSEVDVGKVVTKTDWDLLRFDLVSIQTHQAGASSPLEAAVNTIIKSNPTTQVYTSYLTLVNTLETNRFAVASGQFITDTKASGTYTSDWNQLLQTEVRVTFATAQQARHFFNSGSTVQLVSSRTGGTVTDQNTNWSNLLNSAGTVNFGGQLPASGFFPINGTNFYRLSNVYQTMYTISSSGAYSSNTYRIEAKCDVSDNSGGTGRIIDFRVSWIDSHNASGAGPDNVSGTLSLTVIEKRATGSLSPSGTFTISSPSYSTITISDIQTFALSSANTVNENSTLSVTVTTTNVPNGTVLFWDIEPVSGNINAGDFAATNTLAGIADAVLAGSVTITGNSGTISLKIASSDQVIAPLSGYGIGVNVAAFPAYAAATTEGPEIFRVRLRTGGTSGTVRASTSNITISDTASASLPTFVQIPTTGAHRHSDSSDSRGSAYPHNISYRRNISYHRYRADDIQRLGWYGPVTINALSYNQVEHPNDGQNNLTGTTVTLPAFKIGLAHWPRSNTMANVHTAAFIPVIPTQSFTPGVGPRLIFWPFTSNFNWNGRDDIIICFARGQISTTFRLRGIVETNQTQGFQDKLLYDRTDSAGEYFIGNVPTITNQTLGPVVAVAFYRA